jgi:Carboxypeptidase regulatory-like domain/TonB-dependent Receptor Plug Domain
MDTPMPRALRLALLAALAATPALASVTGNIAGIVTDEATGKPLAGVTVTVSGPALAGEQTEFTDSAGRYIVTELPPGEYLVRFYFSTIKVERPGVFLNADKTLQVNVSMPTQQAEQRTYHVVERAPTVDVGNTQMQTTITNELARNTPIAGDGTGQRTYASLLTLAPGATTEAIVSEQQQYSFNSATGPENNFLIDGLNTTNPSHGLLGTQLSLEFIGETEIITGGYNAEYGRATGGVVNVVTKSGGNQFHGGVWFYYQPFSGDPRVRARIGEAIASTTRLSNHFDFGFDLGGPIIKDKVWFYAGFHPQFSNFESTRFLRTRTADNLPSSMMSGTYDGDVDAATGGFKTRDLGDLYTKRYTTKESLYSWIARLDFQLNPDHHLTVQYLGSVPTSEGVQANFNGAEGVYLATESRQSHDVLAHLVSKWLDRRLQSDALLGFHYETRSQTPLASAGGNRPWIEDTRTAPLTRFEDVAPCAPTLVHGVTFNPCPVSSYHDGGYGLVQDTTNTRLQGGLGLTWFAHLAGTHAVKLGGDFEANSYRNHRQYTGGADGGLYTVLTDGSVLRQQFGTIDDKGGIRNTGSDDPAVSGWDAVTKTFNESLYLRDSWTVGFVPGLTVNAGLRWELQQVQNAHNQTVIDLSDNLAPRLGFVYDWTQKGRSKVYASYGRFYESIPLDLNDRQFSREGLLYQYGSCPTGDKSGDIRLDPSKCNFTAPRRGELNGGSDGIVSPTLKGMYSNEVVAGLQADVGLDLVVGAAYIHRDLGRVIEDISPDGGVSYLIANPGEPADPAVVKQLQDKITAEPDVAKKAALTQQLSLYQQVVTFERPKRDYNALVLTANKRFSNNFIVLASYTYSRSLGNYPGLYQASNGQLDPNISTQYDLRDLLINRNGPLPNDRPHNFKLDGAYTIPVGEGGVTLGLAFNALSGAPIEVLGRHTTYGSLETFILPRGSGGRTPAIWALDAHLAYYRQFSKLLRMDLYADVFNVTNNREVTQVDQEYTPDPVQPIADGTLADLKNLRTLSGTTPTVNPNYRQPTAYQAPISARFGIRVSF